MDYMNTKLEIFNKIKAYKDIIILRHSRPDGDCMGSSLGLREILKTSFPDKNIYSIGRDNSMFLNFLGSEDDDVDEEVYQRALVLVLDTATRDRIDNDKYHLANELIKIDHHIAVENYGTINYIREDFPATASIIMDFYSEFKDELKLTKQAAKYLYVGLVTDTGRFKYRGVNSHVMRLGADMLDAELDLEDIYAHLYIKSAASFKLQGYILNNFKTTENGVSYFFVTKKIQKKFKITPEDASSLVNVLDSIRGNLIWIFFIELEKGIRVRLRSRFVAVDHIANNYRGGGHKQAAGATLYHKKEIKHLLKEADLVLKEFKEKNKEVF